MCVCVHAYIHIPHSIELLRALFLTQSPPPYTVTQACTCVYTHTSTFSHVLLYMSGLQNYCGPSSRRIPLPYMHISTYTCMHTTTQTHVWAAELLRALFLAHWPDLPLHLLLPARLPPGPTGGELWMMPQRANGVCVCVCVCVCVWLCVCVCGCVCDCVRV